MPRGTAQSQSAQARTLSSHLYNALQLTFATHDFLNSIAHVLVQAKTEACVIVVVIKLVAGTPSAPIAESTVRFCVQAASKVAMRSLPAHMT